MISAGANPAMVERKSFGSSLHEKIKTKKSIKTAKYRGKEIFVPM